MDASGDVISSVNLRKQGRYQWLPMKLDIDGLFPVVCKGQLKGHRLLARGHKKIH
jgi:hypothetical protein